jgi:hypothetical protein
MSDNVPYVKSGNQEFSPMPLYRKKSIVVDAQQITQGWPVPKGVETGCSCVAGGGRCSFCGQMWVRDGSGRQLIVHVGDWIVPEKDGSGFYPVAADKFTELYEPA